MANRLSRESSPYLLQHADNPVEWYPWGPEALDKARAHDLPILLSIGYSACHWCHVMERESFEDKATAELMNRDFVPIKVDREERPDLDGIYMKAVQALTGHGGWPLTAFLTPDGVPFYGGTYFPPQPRQGMPSFGQVLTAVSDAWRNRRDDVLRNAEGLREALEAAGRRVFGEEDRAGGAGESGVGAADDEAVLAGAFARLRERFDAAHGGFGSAPKFPQASVLEFLLAYGLGPGGRAEATEMVATTLGAMADGGIRDHLGGGFHRYSVDARWRVPHFEKMLYDNALLARVYLDAWRVTRQDEFKRVGVETLDWILADLRHEEGGFFAARDADSEGKEGHYYVWSPEEVDRAAPDRGTARLFRRVYDVEPGGNFEGRNILHRPHGLDGIARSEGLEAGELLAALAPVRAALLDVRARRPEPLRDEKILCSWNAFTVRALASASVVLDRPDYLDAARASADFLLGELRAGGELRHVWTSGRLGVPAFLEDRAALANACLALHEVTFEGCWLDEAEALCHEIVERHFDEADGLFFDDPDGGEALVVRPREVTDQATPSGTSMAVEALLRAGHLLDRGDWIEVAGRALDRERAGMAHLPAAFGRLLTQLLRRATAPVEVAIMGAPDDPRTMDLRDAVFSVLHPALTLAGADPDGGPDGGLVRDIPLFRDRGTVDGAPAAWVCRDFTCDAPVTDAASVREAMGRSLHDG